MSGGIIQINGIVLAGDWQFTRGTGMSIGEWSGELLSGDPIDIDLDQPVELQLYQRVVKLDVYTDLTVTEYRDGRIRWSGSFRK